MRARILKNNLATQVDPHLIQLSGLMEWKTCIKCDIGRRANRHVLYEVPAGADKLDLLFIGEGPGAIEDLYGRPFVGPAGQLLRDGIAEAALWRDEYRELKVGFSNLIACRPSDNGSANRQPNSRECANCAPRLAKVIEIFDPLVIVLCGVIPDRYWKFTEEKVGWVGRIRNIHHPSYIKRSGGKASNMYGIWIENIQQIMFAALELR